MNFLDAEVAVNGDKAALKFAGQAIELPPAKSKKLIDGGFAGKTVTFGIRPENVYDDEARVSMAQATFEATINVYELLGAEVFLYFTINGSNMTARVNPKTDARTGSEVKFAIDVDKVHVFDKETELTITN
jgi:multiple sugar transport system ATP-binding protein